MQAYEQDNILVLTKSFDAQKQYCATRIDSKKSICPQLVIAIPGLNSQSQDPGLRNL